MKCYFNISTLKTDEDFKRFSSYLTSCEDRQNKIDLLARFYKKLETNPYYMDKRHYIRKRAIRSVDIYMEIQGINTKSFSLKSFVKHVLKWIRDEKLGYVSDYVLYDASGIKGDNAYCRFTYIPVDDNDMINYKKSFSHKFLYLNNSCRTRFASIYKCQMSKQSNIAEEYLFISGIEQTENNVLDAEINSLNNKLSDKEEQIKKLKKKNTDLKGEIYDLKEELKDLRLIADNYNQLQILSGNPKREHGSMMEMVRTIVWSKYAYKYFESMNMQQELNVLQNLKKYASIYLKKHPEEHVTNS